jgi:hypothetical protein
MAARHGVPVPVPRRVRHSQWTDPPCNVYLREDQLLGPLDDWLLTALARARLKATIEAMHASQPDDTVKGRSTRPS